ncbi:MAG: hypothetical protein JXA18_00090, partial [Chitinispirillaceae bacterium]|nr:hypothetical protein [Chitinispirillaceae bacterium]
WWFPFGVYRGESFPVCMTTTRSVRMNPNRLCTVLLTSALLLFSCSGEVQQGVWKTITFMDVENVTHKVGIRLTNAVYDSRTGFLKVDGELKNKMKEKRLFNVRNWVYRLNLEEGKYLKPQSVGLPSIPLQAMKDDGTSWVEKFTLIYNVGPGKSTAGVVLDYADQFFMTGQINNIVISVPLHIESGSVTSRG